MRPFLISTAALLLWALIISPVLCGLFGAPLPMNLRERRIVMRQRSFTRYFWLAGILSFGIGIALASGLNYYLDWRSSEYLWLQPSVGRVLFHAVFWLVFGAIWAWITLDETARFR